MKCCCKNPLTPAEKEQLIKEAEKIKPLSEAEKEILIKNAENDRVRGVCHYHHVQHADLFKKLVLLFGILLALGLFYYLFMLKSKPQAPLTEPTEQVALSTEQAKSESAEKETTSSIPNADKIMVEEVLKEPVASTK